MEAISLLAIGAGILAAIVISAVAGAVFGLGLAADIGKETPYDEEAEAFFDRGFEAESRKPGFVLQMLVLSAASSALAGAITAWLAPQAPYLNAGIVGLAGTVLGLALARSTPGLPPLLNLLGALTTLPATLAGAWLVGS